MGAIAYLSGVDGTEGADAQAVVLARTEPVFDLLQLLLCIVQRDKRLGLDDVGRVSLREGNSPRRPAPLHSRVDNHHVWYCPSP